MSNDEEWPRWATPREELSRTRAAARVVFYSVKLKTISPDNNNEAERLYQQARKLPMEDLIAWRDKLRVEWEKNRAQQTTQTGSRMSRDPFDDLFGGRDSK